MVYIRHSHLPRLKEYKYSGVDKSLTSKYVLKPFYNEFVKLFPMSMAPNLVTLSGFSFVVINVATLLYYNPTLDQDCPTWVYFTWSIGLFLYQTFDACDGAQARRTKQSGPLGELFDHGVDACNTTLEVLLFAGAMNLGYSWWTVLTLFASVCAFFLTTWEEYHTGTLFLGIVNGPVEGILTLCIIYAVTGLKGGGHFWQQSLLHTIGITNKPWIPESMYEFQINHSYLVYGAVILVFNIYQSCVNVIKARRDAGKSLVPALFGLFPFFSLWVLIPAWLYMSPNILRQHLIPFIFFLGACFAYQVGLIITAHLVKAPYPYFNILILPVALGVVDAALNKFGEKGFGRWGNGVLGDGEYLVGYVFLCLGLSIGIYGSFVVDVIMNICDYLDIWCLTIKHPYVPEEEKKTQ